VLFNRLSVAARRAAGLRPWPPGGLVLLYHRIADLSHDPQRLAVTPERFADHLDIVREHGVPMDLGTLVALAKEDALPQGAVAVTFDDGYADNLAAAAPLLTRANVPASIFVTTGAMREGREFWWDEAERLMLGHEECARFAGWTVESGACPTVRHREYLDLCHRLRLMSEHDRDRVLASLAAGANSDRDARPSHRPLSAAEVRTLAARPGITIGSHTKCHTSLAALESSEQRHTIQDAVDELGRITGESLTAFAYPFGGSSDVSADTLAAARAAGVTVACTSQPGSVRRDTDCMRVPRLIVRNWTREEFLARWLSWS